MNENRTKDFWDSFFKEKYISKEMWEEASSMCGDWTTCYTSLFTEGVKRNGWFEPIDSELFKLGDSLNDAIKSKHFASAKYQAFKIEKRCGFLAKLQAKNHSN